MDTKITETEKKVGNVTQKTHKEELRIPQFTIDNVLTTVELKDMSRKQLVKHVEYLEQIAIQLNQGLVITVGELNLALKRERDMQNMM